jgi:hypothetical protein
MNCARDGKVRAPMKCFGPISACGVFDRFRKESVRSLLGVKVDIAGGIEDIAADPKTTFAPMDYWLAQAQ